MWAKFAVQLIVALVERLTPTVVGYFRRRTADKQLEADRKAIRDAVAAIPKGQP